MVWEISRSHLHGIRSLHTLSTQQAHYPHFGHYQWHWNNPNAHLDASNVRLNAVLWYCGEKAFSLRNIPRDRDTVALTGADIYVSDLYKLGWTITDKSASVLPACHGEVTVGWEFFPICCFPMHRHVVRSAPTILLPHPHQLLPSPACSPVKTFILHRPHQEIFLSQGVL